MPQEQSPSITTCLFIMICCATPLAAQERTKTAPQSKPQTQSSAAKVQEPSGEVLSVNTRAVFVDTLVRDKKTNAPVTGLAPESFQVLDDGKPRPLVYFSREGTGRARPLAVVLALDLCTESIVYLERPDVMERVVASLAKLHPDDEVSVVQTWCEPDAPRSFLLKSKTVEALTRDREKTYAALRGVREFAEKNRPQIEMLLSLKAAMKGSWKEGILGGLGTAVGAAPTEPPIKVTLAPDFEYTIDKAPQIAARERPASQVVIVEVSDGLESDRVGHSEETARKLIESGVTVCGLNVKRSLLGKAVEVTGRVVSPIFGLRFHTITYYGRQTGGEVETVGTPEQFAAAVERIIGGIAARYSLGFSLADADLDDGHMHKLEVKVRAVDERGHTRKLVVVSRRGYYSRQRPQSADVK